MSYAYVPEQAIDRHNEVTGNAFKLFVWYCSKANEQTGESFYKSDRVAIEMKWKKNHVYEHRRALAEAHWISIDADHVKILFGFPRSSAKSENGTSKQGEDHPERTPITTKAKSKKRTKSSPKTVLIEVLKPDQTGPKMGPVKSENGTSEVRKPDSSGTKTGLPYKEEPDQLTRPINQTIEPVGGSDDPPSSEPPKADKVTLEKIFFERYVQHYGSKYQSKSGDFVQLNAMIKTQGESLTVADFEQALENYFDSDSGVHTLAALCTNYSAYRLHPLDRYKQPKTANGAVLFSGKTAGNGAVVKRFLERGK